MTRIFNLIFFLIHLTSLITSKNSPIHHCQVEPYTEIINLRTCLNSSISINTTRCREQCYSEDSLIHDWQYAPTYYRHKHLLHCCLPNNTKSHETRILCDNKQLKIIKYQIVTKCQCKSCSNRCLD